MENLPQKQRITQMIEVLSRVARGDYLKITLSGKNDDLDSLSIGINTMIDNIKSKSESANTKLLEMERENEELRIVQDASEIVVKDLDDKRRELKALNNELQRETEEHRKTAEDLKDSEEKFRTMSASAQDAMIMIDNGGRVTFWNNAAENIFGYSSEEIMGKDLHQYIVPKEYHEGCQAGFFSFKETGVGNAVGKTLELRGLGKDGKEFPIELSMSSVHLKGEWNAIGIIRDITERKKGEIELQKRTHDLAERIKEMNCLYETSKLMADSKMSTGDVISEIVKIIPTSWQYPEVTCSKIVLHGKEYISSNFRESNWKQHADIWMNDVLTGAVEVYYVEEKPEADEGPFLSEERNLIDALAREIGKFSERKGVEEEKQSFLEKLKEKNKELDDFTYIVSHDLKAPLITIQGFSDLLKRKYKDQLDERAIHYLDNMVTAANDLNLLITDLLDYSRAGRKEIKRERVSLQEAVKRSLFSLSGMVNETNAKIHVPDDLPEISYDPVKLGQVLNNLLSNALKYSSAKRVPDIDIGWKEEDNKIKLWIKDNGMGIKQDDIGKVFQPFVRVTNEKKGSGIGLSIVKTIVERHGGNIWVDSQIDQGSTFYMTIMKEK